jgi:hypothetical protein
MSSPSRRPQPSCESAGTLSTRPPDCGGPPTASPDSRVSRSGARFECQGRASTSCSGGTARLSRRSQACPSPVLSIQKPKDGAELIDVGDVSESISEFAHRYGRIPTRRLNTPRITPRTPPLHGTLTSGRHPSWPRQLRMRFTEDAPKSDRWASFGECLAVRGSVPATSAQGLSSSWAQSGHKMGWYRPPRHDLARDGPVAPCTRSAP